MLRKNPRAFLWVVYIEQRDPSGWIYVALKYTVFINSLLVQLKTSGYCYKIYRLPSAPVGYADDFASGCINEFKLNQVMKMVYRHECTWRYEFNARKGGVLIYSGDPNPVCRNTPLKEFSLGAAKVKEALKLWPCGYSNFCWFKRYIWDQSMNFQGSERF